MASSFGKTAPRSEPELTGMKEFTQSNTSPGNCWQTAVACVLEVAPASLPDQVAIEEAERSYQNALGTYLRKHHGLLYLQIEAFKMRVLSVREPGWHCLIGETVRTYAALDGQELLPSGRAASRILHVVVARHGEMAWDPHPSHAGLTKVLHWGFLFPFPDEYRESWDRVGMDRCQCLACGGKLA